MSGTPIDLEIRLLAALTPRKRLHENPPLFRSPAFLSHLTSTLLVGSRGNHAAWAIERGSGTMTKVIIIIVIAVILVFALFRSLYVIVGRAVDNAIDWTIYTFGNEDAVRQLRERNRRGRNG